MSKFYRFGTAGRGKPARGRSRRMPAARLVKSGGTTRFPSRTSGSGEDMDARPVLGHLGVHLRSATPIMPSPTSRGQPRATGSSPVTVGRERLYAPTDADTRCRHLEWRSEVDRRAACARCLSRTAQPDVPHRPRPSLLTPPSTRWTSYHRKPFEQGAPFCRQPLCDPSRSTPSAAPCGSSTTANRTSAAS
jgi:hypothetical protein